MTPVRHLIWIAVDVSVFLLLLALLAVYDIRDKHRLMSGMFAIWAFQWRAIVFIMPIWLLSLFFTRQYLSGGDSDQYGLAVLWSLPAATILMIALGILLPLMFPSDGM